jgi:hypothetical protein
MDNDKFKILHWTLHGSWGLLTPGSNSGQDTCAHKEHLSANRNARHDLLVTSPSAPHWWSVTTRLWLR